MQRIPEQGRPWTELETELEASKQDDFSWRQGRMALYYYFRDDALMQVQKDSYTAFWNENGMAQRAFPSLKKLEGEVIEMGLSLMNAPPGATATFTSGGSESIFMALKTARDWAKAEKGITRPNFVVPRTAHPTFTRAGQLLGVDVIRVPTTRNDFRADVAALERRIDADTIGLVGSAPNYPFGVFDPIGEIASLAKRRGLWMHVDACIGGFLAPFARDIGHDIPSFDFAHDGVVSMSADLHKYGMAAKGASLMLLRDKALQDKYQVFNFNDWERGAYSSPLTTGTRPAGAIAAAWAVLHYLGREGYRENARIIMDTKARLVVGINAIPGLAVLEPHELCIFVYRSVDPNLDIAAVAESLLKRRWFVGRQAEPPGIHVHLNTGHVVAVDDYLRDLADAVAEARGRSPATQSVERTY
jgi:glutamate/tyrosine decarboxylase-like PLP-dependent enzyme